MKKALTLTLLLISFTFAEGISKLNPKQFIDSVRTLNADYKQYDTLLILKKLSSIIENDETNDLAYRVRGDVFFQKGDFDKAKRDYRNAIKLNGVWRNWFLQWGYSLYTERSYDGSILLLNKHLLLYPTAAKAYEYRCLSNIRKESFKAALRDYDSAQKYDTLYRSTDRKRIAVNKFIEEGELCFINAQYHKSRRIFSHALKIDSTYPKIYYHRALSSLSLLDTVSTIQDLKMFETFYKEEVDKDELMELHSKTVKMLKEINPRRHKRSKR